jgi:hypothetical protein
VAAALTRLQKFPRNFKRAGHQLEQTSFHHSFAHGKTTLQVRDTCRSSLAISLLIYVTTGTSVHVYYAFFRQIIKADNLHSTSITNLLTAIAVAAIFLLFQRFP